MNVIPTIYVRPKAYLTMEDYWTVALILVLKQYNDFKIIEAYDDLFLKNHPDVQLASNLVYISCLDENDDVYYVNLGNDPLVDHVFDARRLHCTSIAMAYSLANVVGNEYHDIVIDKMKALHKDYYPLFADSAFSAEVITTVGNLCLKAAVMALATRLRTQAYLEERTLRALDAVTDKIIRFNVPSQDEGIRWSLACIPASANPTDEYLDRVLMKLFAVDTQQAVKEVTAFVLVLDVNNTAQLCVSPYIKTVPLDILKCASDWNVVSHTGTVFDPVKKLCLEFGHSELFMMQLCSAFEIMQHIPIPAHLLVEEVFTSPLEIEKFIEGTLHVLRAGLYENRGKCNDVAHVEREIALINEVRAEMAHWNMQFSNDPSYTISKQELFERVTTLEDTVGMRYYGTLAGSGYTNMFRTQFIEPAETEDDTSANQDEVERVLAKLGEPMDILTLFELAATPGVAADADADEPAVPAEETVTAEKGDEAAATSMLDDLPKRTLHTREGEPSDVILFKVRTMESIDEHPSTLLFAYVEGNKKYDGPLYLDTAGYIVPSSATFPGIGEFFAEICAQPDAYKLTTEEGYVVRLRTCSGTVLAFHTVPLSDNIDIDIVKAKFMLKNHQWFREPRTALGYYDIPGRSKVANVFHATLPVAARDTYMPPNSIIIPDKNIGKKHPTLIEHIPTFRRRIRDREYSNATPLFILGITKVAEETTEILGHEELVFMAPNYEGFNGNSYYQLYDKPLYVDDSGYVVSSGAKFKGVQNLFWKCCTKYSPSRIFDVPPLAFDVSPYIIYIRGMWSEDAAVKAVSGVKSVLHRRDFFRELRKGVDFGELVT